MSYVAISLVESGKREGAGGREREREREGGRGRERKRERETDRDRERERNTWLEFFSNVAERSARYKILLCSLQSQYWF